MKHIIQIFATQILMIGVSFQVSAASLWKDAIDVDYLATFSKGLSSLHRTGITTSQLPNDSLYFDLSGGEIFKLIGLIGFCCVTVVVVVTKYRKSMKNDRYEYESEIHKAKLKLAALREKQVLLTEEFEMSSNRLKDVAEQLENKRQLLANIKQLVELTNSEQLVSSEAKSKILKIGRNIQYSFHVDQEWYHFRSYFENANEQFLSSLKERFPSLSPNDYKLCVLYKIDSDHERVASIMEISSESARVMKHRLKKKLELPLNVCLSEFLRGFDADLPAEHRQMVS
jgi:hypothetical protein